jgi:hypothetical protein
LRTIIAAGATRFVAEMFEVRDRFSDGKLLVKLAEIREAFVAPRPR